VLERLFALLINLLPLIPRQPRQLVDELGAMREIINSDGRLRHRRICFAVRDFAKDDDACLAVGATVFPRLRDEGGSVSPDLCCNGANVPRSRADVGEAVLSTSSLAAAFNSVHRDNG
jgi:hypothetical protein